MEGLLGKLFNTYGESTSRSKKKIQRESKYTISIRIKKSKKMKVSIGTRISPA
jgi:hypothetical protein